MTFKDLVTNIIADILTPLPALLLALALALFFWGLVKYMQSEAAGGKGKGRTLMLWGVVVLFVMVSVWGLVNVIKDSFDLSNTNLEAIPSRQ